MPGQPSANAYKLLIEDAMGPPLDNCFDQARQSGISWQQLETVRRQIEQEKPVSLGAVLLQNAGIRLCLATEGYIIAGMAFVSRQQVDAIKAELFQPFQEAEEIAADDMDQMTFQALITLHGAITNHLVQTALPLPRMLGYRSHPHENQEPADQRDLRALSSHRARGVLPRGVPQEDLSEHRRAAR